MSAKFLLLLSKVKPIWEHISNLFLDFENEVYSVEGTPSTLSSYVTHSRSGNATMTDSDGLIKWAPHNLLRYSEQFDNGVWSKINCAVVANQGLSPNNTLTADLQYSTSAAEANVRQSFEVISGIRYTVATFFKDSGRGFAGIGGYGAMPLGTTTFNLSTGEVETLSANHEDARMVAVGSGWYLCEIDFIATSTGTATTIQGASTASSFSSSETTSDYAVLIWGAHVHRSDLGGMVDNPDRGDSYVPTTSSALYLPRRNHYIYNGSASVKEGLFIESESRQNICLQSEDITTTWSPNNATLTANDTTAPDGNTTADKLNDDSGTGTGAVYVYQAITVSAATQYTASVFLKADQLAFALLQALNYDGATNGNQFFGLSGAGSLGTAFNLDDSSITAYPDGWYRCSITWTQGAADTSFQFRIYVADSISNSNVDLDGTSSIFVWGAQVEAGATPSSYIPTTTASVTRAAETLTIPAANLPYPSPVVIGSELVTNGTFDTDTTGWSGDNATLSSVSGQLVVTPTTTNQTAYSQVTLEIGKVYLVSADLVDVNGSASDKRLKVGTTITGGQMSQTIVASTPQTIQAAFVATATTAYVNVYTFDGTNAMVWDNISVKEINPLSVSIQMDGTITYADTDVAVEAIFHRWLFDGNNQIQARLDTASTDTGQVQFYSIANTVVDIVESSATAYSPGINVPFNIASRHGSTFINGAVEGTALTANTTPTALPDLSATDLELAYDFMGTIRTFRIWDEDLTDEGIEYVSQ